MKCERCGHRLDDGFSKSWALLWDGQLWRMYDWLPGMAWGPYCTACVNPVINSLNAAGTRPENMAGKVPGRLDPGKPHWFKGRRSIALNSDQSRPCIWCGGQPSHYLHHPATVRIYESEHPEANTGRSR